MQSAREAIARGDVEKARLEMVFVAQTIYEDLRDALKRKK